MEQRKTFPGAIVCIVGYKPKEGMDNELAQLMREHVQILRGQGLATDRVPIVSRANDGTFVEVFEWKSAKAIEDAHSNPEVLKMWERFDKACTFEPIGNLAESKDMFPSFEPFN